MSTLIALLPILLIMATTIGGVVAMIGRADIPASERLPIRRWTVRDVAANASIGWRVVREVMAVAYGARNRSFSSTPSRGAGSEGALERTTPYESTTTRSRKPRCA